MDNKTETEKKEWDQMLKESFYPIKIKDILNPLTYTLTQKLLFFLVFLTSIALIFLGNRTTLLSLEKKPEKKEEFKAILNKHEASINREDLIQKVKSKSIFKRIKKLPPPAVKNAIAKGPGLQDKLKNFVLLGVLIEEPMQAMIESRATHETFCVKAGDMITDIQVTGVENGKVTLSYNEETGVLR